MIASVSGVRGRVNSDISIADFARLASNFAQILEAKEVLLGRDTRTTGAAISMAVAGALLSRGAKVLDFGVISTPALFRESRKRGRPAVMVTASHNEPEFNGLKFIQDGFGVSEEAIEEVVAIGASRQEGFRDGSFRLRARPAYNGDLVARFGEGSCTDVRVSLDLGGGAAIEHAVPVLRKLGCEVLSINDTPGVFNRRIDPIADELGALRRMVKGKGYDLGLAFDCDGDRLVIVDGSGRKRSGDYMLTLALSLELARGEPGNLVVSTDTTVAVEEVAAKAGGRVFRSKVGETNVVRMMQEKGARLGGEGSSGGLIDGSFNYCRDSMLAALIIIRGVKEKGGKVFESVRSYHLERGTVELARPKAFRAVRALAKQHGDADTTDGAKIWLSKRSWVLVRPSNTEDVVRVSAEAETATKAAQLVRSYSRRVRELSS